jgi:hypothetical protein
LSAAGSPSLQRVGVSGQGRSCAFAAVLLAADPVLPCLASQLKVQQYSKLKTAEQRQTALRLARNHVAKQVNQQLLSDTGLSQADAQLIQRELRGDGDLDGNIMHLLAHLLNINIFVQEDSQSLHNGAVAASTLIWHCACKFQAGRDCVFLHARSTTSVENAEQLAAADSEDDKEASMNDQEDIAAGSTDSKTPSNVFFTGGHFSLLRVVSSKKSRLPADAPTSQVSRQLLCPHSLFVGCTGVLFHHLLCGCQSGICDCPALCNPAGGQGTAAEEC